MMHFGLNKKVLAAFALLTLTIYSCKDEQTKYLSFKAPEGGAKFGAGSKFRAQVDFSGSEKPDSVQYFLDTKFIGSRKDTVGLEISTEGISLGNHVLSARVHKQESMEEVTTNVIVVASGAPRSFGFRTVNTFPHDNKSYVQGLEFHDGILYESAGLTGQSRLRKVDLTTGRSIQEVPVPGVFAEGLTVVGNKIVQVTYTERIGFVYDKQTLKKTGEFTYAHAPEGWGLCFDGNTIYNSTGQSTIYLLDKDTYKVRSSFEVYDHNGPVDSLNELEWIDGKIYANVYTLTGPYANKILVIDPKSGAVEETINLIGIHPLPDLQNEMDYILNGIAWDKAGKRLFITGKNWPKLFQIEKVPN